MTLAHAADVAYAMGPPPGGGGGAGDFLSLLPLFLGMFAIMYFVMIRPQQKERQRRESMLAAVKKGDRVVTTSGLHGTVIALTEHTVTLRAGDQVKLEFDRAAIGRVVEVTGDKDG
jgi:preprotein translocase subunit YajC